MSGHIDLTGKVAIVTGSGQGLGLAYAKALAAAGAKVVVNDVDGAAAERAVAAITEAGGAAVAVVAPVGPTSTADLLVQTAVEEFGRLDVLVANAGVLRDRVLWKMADADFDDVVGTHLRGTFTTVRAAAIRLREQGEGGRIVVIGSPAGQHGNFGQTSYAAAKAGVVVMARTWSLELARAQVTVNVVVPTAITAMTATIPVYQEVAAAYERGETLPHVVRREHALGGPEDVAPLIVWLASDSSAGVTGQAIGVGGDKLSLYSYSEELAVTYREGGWSAEAIAEAWPSTFAPARQTSGITLPPLDADAAADVPAR
ncbi:SDR family NAD(P)-dependent oxidoreductase [Promicromonospora sp. CA-289599]|uniref:SDR family NAD(P)-dependent oxidoreductase n=1 Tax=Promicromonospora sp. CA-289599 TaxID=3240014 RepID=UPI003D8E4EC9